MRTLGSRPMDELFDEYYAARHSSDTLRKVRARQAIEEMVAPAATKALRDCLMRDRSFIGSGDLDRVVDQMLGGTLIECPVEGVHLHPFRGPHRFREWEPGT